MREFTDEESNLCLLLNRVVDMQNPERHTVSLVVSLFVHFLANKRCGPADNAKKLSVSIIPLAKINFFSDRSFLDILMHFSGIAIQKNALLYLLRVLDERLFAMLFYMVYLEYWTQIC